MKKLEKGPDTKEVLIKSIHLNYDLYSDEEFNNLVNEVNEHCYYWDKVKYLKVPNRFKVEDVWAMAKLKRAYSPYSIVFGGFKFQWFLNTSIQQQLHLFDLNIGGSLESKGIIPSEEKNRYLISSIMEEAIASSQIEGAITTRKAAKEMLRKNKSPRNKSEQMILNNYISIQKILEWKNEELTEEKLLELHRLVTRKTMEDSKDEGRFRDDNETKVVDATDGEVAHYPPDYRELKPLMKELYKFFNQDKNDIFIHPIIKACILHFMIGFIHPFVDGNGRTARALFYWYLLKKGYWLTEYLSISRLILKSKEQYAKAYLYTEIDDNDLTYFISYKLKVMKQAYDALREYLQRKMEEKKRVTDYVRIENVNERQALMLKWIHDEPSSVLTVKEIETRLSVSNQTARTDLQGLVDLGYLEAIQLNKKAQAFGKSRKFDALVRRKMKM